MLMWDSCNTKHTWILTWNPGGLMGLVRPLTPIHTKPQDTRGAKRA